jgi:aminoglycoside 6'-N-acetyltransferase
LTEFLRTERVILRRLSTADLTAFQGYRNDSVVGQYQGWSVMTDEEAAAFLGEMSARAAFPAGDWFQLGIADLVSDKLIGDVGVHVSKDETEAEIGFTLAAEYQGRGFGAEAVGALLKLLFETTPIKRVIAITDARNTACIALLERVGMSLVESEQALFRGEPCVEHRFQMERD